MRDRIISAEAVRTLQRDSYRARGLDRPAGERVSVRKSARAPGFIRAGSSPMRGRASWPQGGGLPEPRRKRAAASRPFGDMG